MINEIPLKKTAGVVESSGILCSFHWIKVSFHLNFAVIYIYAFSFMIN